MVTSGNRRYGTPILRTPDSRTIIPKRISFTEKSFQEGWVQELIRTTPEVLPVIDIEPVFAPLIPIGKEVSTPAGSIDNLYLSPQGYLTIAETKLWRNPKARREVVGQIIDYAKEVSRWTYEDLDRQVHAYTERYHESSTSVLDIIQTTEPTQEFDEASIVDTISRNLQRARFLLLIVGDGIRESVEAMVDFLSQTPQLYFSLALVEIQVYELDTGTGKTLLVIPQVVARTREITRAVVRVEGKTTGAVHVGVDTQVGPEIGKRFTLSEERYFEILEQNVAPDIVRFAQQLITDAEEMGCGIEWKQASYVIKLPDPAGSGQNLTLLVVQKDGKAWVGWLPGQLRTVGLPEQIGLDFVQDSARLFKGCGVSKKDPGVWTRSVGLDEIRQKYKDFLSVVQAMIDRVGKASSESE